MGADSFYKIDEVSYGFSLLIIEFYKYMSYSQKEYTLGKQVLRSGTSIWANIMEAQDAQSKKDFLHKMNISLKEAKETKYRLSLLQDSWYMSEFLKRDILLSKINELIGVLTKIVKTTKQNLSI